MDANVEKDDAPKTPHQAAPVPHPPGGPALVADPAIAPAPAPAAAFQSPPQETYGEPFEMLKGQRMAMDQLLLRTKPGITLRAGPNEWHIRTAKQADRDNPANPYQMAAYLELAQPEPHTMARIIFDIEWISGRGFVGLGLISADTGLVKIGTENGKSNCSICCAPETEIAEGRQKATHYFDIAPGLSDVVFFIGGNSQEATELFIRNFKVWMAETITPPPFARNRLIEEAAKNSTLVDEAHRARARALLKAEAERLEHARLMNPHLSSNIIDKNRFTQMAPPEGAAGAGARALKSASAAAAAGAAGAKPPAKLRSVLSAEAAKEVELRRLHTIIAMSNHAAAEARTADTEPMPAETDRAAPSPAAKTDLKPSDHFNLAASIITDPDLTESQKVKGATRLYALAGVANPDALAVAAIEQEAFEARKAVEAQSAVNAVAGAEALRSVSAAAAAGAAPADAEDLMYQMPEVMHSRMLEHRIHKVSAKDLGKDGKEKAKKENKNHPAKAAPSAAMKAKMATFGSNGSAASAATPKPPTAAAKPVATPAAAKPPAPKN
jgi:hypothetical protein